MVQRGGQRFPRTTRLSNSQQFRRVFAASQRSTDPFFTVLAARNGAGVARIGVIVAKKNVKPAVTRNRIKRVVRESFRHARRHLSGLDLVVMARPGTAAQGNRTLGDSLAMHWYCLSRLSAK